MTKYSSKKVAVFVALAVAVIVAGSLSFIRSASAAMPSAQTLSATGIFDDSAQLNGYLYTGGEDTTYWFEYGTSRSNLDRDTTEKDVDDRDGRVTVSNTLRNGLTPGRTYYFRLVAENEDGTDRGDILSFVADDDDSGSNDDDSSRPVMRTSSARPSGTSAVLNGTVDSDANWVQVWFRYGQNPASLGSRTPNLTIFGSANRSFSQTAENLVPGVTYYYQAAGMNSSGTSYGQTLSFVAGGNGNGGGFQGGAGAPLASTGSAQVTGRDSATLNAQVNPNGVLSSVWFEYGRTSSLGSVTTRDPAGSGAASARYSVNLSGLSAGTTYYYRAAAQNTSGTSRGQILSFRTAGAAPAPVDPVDNDNDSDNDDDDDNDSGGNATSTPAVLGVTSTPVSAPDCFTVSPSISSAQLKAGDDLTYSVTYRNSCAYTLSSGSLQITLPVATEFAGTNYPFLSRDGNVITYNIGVIAPNFQSAVTVNGKVREQVAIGDSLVFEANVTFTDPNGALQNATGLLTATITEGGAATGSSTLGASAADALSGLFHSGWFWLVLFLILVALFVFWLATRRRNDEDEDDDIEVEGEAQAHGH